MLTRDIQFHPVTDVPLHLDMLRVGASSKVAVGVPVEFINHELSPGLKIGGVLNIVRYEVELMCPAGDIPEKITVDLDDVKIGDSIHISSIALPEGVEPTITDRDFTVATLQSPGGGVKNEDEDASGVYSSPSASAVSSSAPSSASSILGMHLIKGGQMQLICPFLFADSCHNSLISASKCTRNFRITENEIMGRAR